MLTGSGTFASSTMIVSVSAAENVCDSTALGAPLDRHPDRRNLIAADGIDRLSHPDLPREWWARGAERDTAPRRRPTMTRPLVAADDSEGFSFETRASVDLA
jgi:hypothetical protein